MRSQLMKTVRFPRGDMPELSYKRPMQSRDLCEAFGLPPTSPIPLDYADERVIDGTLVVLTPARQGKHRFFAVCDCGAFVPAGRLHQHQRGAACLAIREGMNR